MAEKASEITDMAIRSPLPAWKWSQEEFDRLKTDQLFPSIWDAHLPKAGATAADAPAGYITLYIDFFCDGNFRLPVTEFIIEILHYYQIHISQLSPMGMVRIRHFEFLCRAHDLEPTVEKFRVFYQLQCALGFYSFGQRQGAKKILTAPPKAFPEWKQNFFYIKAAVVPLKMAFRAGDDILLEVQPIPHNEVWYQELREIPNIGLVERALVAAGMSIMWRPERRERPVYVENGKGKLYFLRRTVHAQFLMRKSY